MTKVKFNRVLPSCTATMLAQTGQTASDADVSEIVFSGSEPEKYESFEGDGFSLTDESAKMAEPGDAVGAVMDDNDASGDFIKLTFESPVELSGGVRLKVMPTEWEDTGLFFRVKVKLYDNQFGEGTPTTINSDIITYKYGSEQIDISASKLKSGNYIYCKELTIPGILAPDRYCTHIINISQINDFGECAVIGQPELHFPSAPLLDDLPMATADFTVEVSGEIPQGGDEIIIESGSLKQSFFVDELTHIGGNIYQLSCSDQIRLTDAWTIYNGGMTNSVLHNLRGDTLKCPITIEPLPAGIDGTYGGLWTGQITCRQAYAMYQAALGCILTSMHARGLRWVQLIGASKTPVKTFTSSDILGRAEFSNAERYGKVSMTADWKWDEEDDDSYDLYQKADGAKGSLSIYDYSKMWMHIYDVDGGSRNPPVHTLERLAGIVNADEATFSTVYGGESIGDWVQIELPNGDDFVGYISEATLIVSVNNIVATYKLRGEKV